MIKEKQTKLEAIRSQYDQIVGNPSSDSDDPDDPDKKRSAESMYKGEKSVRK